MRRKEVKCLNILTFSAINMVGVFSLPLDGMPVYCRDTSRFQFAGTHSYTYVNVERQCFVQEHDAISDARA